MRVKLRTTMSGPDGNFAPGSVIDVDAGAALDLCEGGYAEALDPLPGVTLEIPTADGDGVQVLMRSADVEMVEIPEDWRKMPAKALKELADELVAEPVKTRNDAIAVIEAELAARAGAKSAPGSETATLDPPETPETPAKPPGA